MKKKKGFTLVELLVVIGILSILATVTVVGYFSFVKKANVSNDTSLVSQLNLLLKADEAINGKAKTPTDVLKITEESGYDVEKLTPTTDNYDIVWNQESNQFALLDEEDNLIYGELSNVKYYNWKFVDSYNNMSNFSIYLKGNNTLDSLEINSSFDVGKNIINTLTYQNSTNKSQNITIRTNGNILNIDGFVDANKNGDVINHFGKSNYVNLNKVANHSYHEFGRTNLISLNEGRLVIEDYKDTEIKKIFINTNEFDGKWKSNEDVIIGLVNNAKLPKSITRGKLSGNINDVIVISELQHLSSNSSLLKKEYIKIFINKKDNQNNYVSFNAFISNNNNIDGNEAKNGYVEGKTDNNLFDLEDKIYYESISSETNLLSEGQNKNNLIEDALSISNGVGSQSDPYLIVGSSAFKHLESNKFYKVMNDLTIKDTIEYKDAWGDSLIASANKINNVVIDFNNKNIKSLCKDYLFGDIRNSTIKNATFDLNYTLCYFALNSKFENITIKGNIDLGSDGHNNAAFVSYSYFDITFENCINQSNITADGGWSNYNSIFLGYPVTSNSVLTFDSCINEGSLTCGTASMFFANPHYTKQKVIINNCINKGRIHATYKSDSIYTFNPINSVTNDGTQTYLTIILNGQEYKGSKEINSIPTYFFGGEFINGSNIDLKLEIISDNLLVSCEDVTDISYFKVNIGVYAILKKGGSQLNIISEIVQVNSQPTLKLYKFVDEIWVKNHVDAVKEEFNNYILYTLAGEKYYYLVNPETSTLNGREKEITEYSLSAFDKDNNLIASVGLIK